MDLLLVEGADVGGGHFQRFEEFRVGGGKGLVNFLLAHLHGFQRRTVKFQGVVLQRRIAAGAHIGNDGVHGGLHIRLGADVPVEDFLRFQSVKLINLNHSASASRILSSSRVSCRYLNL